MATAASCGANTSIAARTVRGAAGFFTLMPLDGVGLMELTRGPHTTALAAERPLSFYAYGLGEVQGWALPGTACIALAWLAACIAARFA